MSRLKVVSLYHLHRLAGVRFGLRTGFEPGQSGCNLLTCIILHGFFIVLPSCSDKVTDTEEMIKIAARAEEPYARLMELYHEAVLPEVTEESQEHAWIHTERLAWQVSQNNRFGFQPDTTKFPFAYCIGILSKKGVVRTATGDFCREYFVQGYFYVEKTSGPKAKLNISVHFYTCDNEIWKPYQLVVEDPDLSGEARTLVSVSEGPYNGFKPLMPPDSLLALLDTRIRKRTK